MFRIKVTIKEEMFVIPRKFVSRDEAELYAHSPGIVEDYPQYAYEHYTIEEENE